MNNLNLLEVVQFNNKKRYGVKSDGGYVVGEVNTKYDCYVSCGVADEESFTADFLNEHKYIEKKDSFAFDGTIKDYPWRFTKNITFINKNIGPISDDKNTNLKDITDKYNNIFLSMDIEGGEYPWIVSLDDNTLNKFAQIVIELHGISGNNWNSPYKTKVKCLEKLLNSHYIIHAHANNYGHAKNNMPEVLELTYLSRKFFKTKPDLNTTKLPIPGLDYPNKENKQDIILDRYPFVKMLS